ARREAMFERIVKETKDRALSKDQLRERILPHTDYHVGGSILLRLLQEQYDRLQAIRALRRFARSVPPDLPPLLSTEDETATVPVLSEAAGSTGFIDFIRPADGVARYVPLWASNRKFAFPQMGLSLACAMLDVDLKDVQLNPDRVVIPRRGGADITIPV